MSYKALFKALKQGEIKPLYLFTGDEQLLIRQGVQQLKELVIDPKYADFNLVTLDGEECSVDQLFGALETLPFFQDRKLVIVKDAPYFKSTQDKLSDTQRERLEGLLAAPAADTVLVFLAPQTDKRKRVSKALAAHGEWVSFDKLERPDYEKWLQRQVESAGMRIAAADIKYLADVTGYLDKESDKTLMDIGTDIERLLGYAGSVPDITRTHIDEIFKKPLVYNIFMMVDCIADGQPSQALGMLKELKQDGEADIKILFMIARHYRILLRTLFYSEARLPDKDIASKAGVPPFLVKKYMTQARRITLSGIRAALEDILDADRSIKTGRMDPEIGLELLMVRLGSFRAAVR